MAFSTYSLGRSKGADLQFDDPGISRLHVEITRTADGRLYLVDANSTAGTYIWRNNDWAVIKQGFIVPEDQLAFGKMKIAARDLYTRIARLQPHQENHWDPVSIKPKRSALTGEIERD